MNSRKRLGGAFIGILKSHSSSKNALSFSSVHTTKRFPSLYVSATSLLQQHALRLW
jgi:hypothetical protein